MEVEVIFSPYFEPVHQNQTQDIRNQVSVTKHIIHAPNKINTLKCIKHIGVYGSIVNSEDMSCKLRCKAV